MTERPDNIVPLPQSSEPDHSPSPLPHDPYDSAMTSSFSLAHRYILKSSLECVSSEGTNLSTLRDMATKGPIFFTTPSIGQFEYHILNAFFLNNELPLCQFASDLQTSGWQNTAQHAAQIKRRLTRFLLKKRRPHPVRSGYIETLLDQRQSLLIQMKTSILYDDLYWLSSENDPLHAALSWQKKNKTPCFIVPLQIIWDKQPDKPEKTLIDVLFGTRHQPGRLRKLILFLRNHKNNLTIHIGEPVPLESWLHKSSPPQISTQTEALRGHILSSLDRDRIGITGPALKPRRWMIEQTVEHPSVKQTIYKLAEDQNRKIEDLERLAKNYADEIATNVNYRVVELMVRLFRFVFGLMYERIEIAPESIQLIREQVAKGPVVLVPNHRSHVDYLLISQILYSHRVALPYCAAGINMSFWPFGPIARRSGAFFLRRSFKGNALYRSVFGAYLHILVREGHCTEFFIEGGRSRTGKSLKPRMGMLSMYTHAMREGGIEDICFIPMTLTYDQVAEERAYLSELSGAEKKKESGRDLLQLTKFLRRRYGRVHIGVGAPCHFSEAVQAIASHGDKAQSLSEENKPKIVSWLASELMARIEQNTLVTPAALTSTAILLQDTRAVTLDQVHEHLPSLLKYLRAIKAPLADIIEKDYYRACSEALVRFEENRQIKAHREFSPLCYELSNQKRFHLDLAKNTIVHYFAPLSCLTAILRAHFYEGQDQISREDIRTDLHLCEELFAHEFRFGYDQALQHSLETLLSYAEEQKWLSQSADHIHLTLSGAQKMAPFAAILRNFFAGYYSTLVALDQLPLHGLDEKETIRFTLNFSRHLLLLGRIKVAEAVSRDIIRHAIKSYVDMGIIQVDGPAGDSDSSLKLNEDMADKALNLKLKLEKWT